METNAHLEIEYVNPHELVPYEKNTRKHGTGDVENIKKSIMKYGFNDPIGVWKDNLIIEGHGRQMAAIELGMPLVPIVHLDHLSDEERREYAILHNWTAEQSTWDFENIEAELSELDMDDFDLGFDFDKDEDGEAKDDEYEVEPPAEPKSKLGQIYKLGRHRLMCGDSTKTADVQRLCGGVMVDMLLTDPPYGVAYVGKTKDALKIENDAKNDEDFLDFLGAAFMAAESVMKPGAVFYIWHADSKSGIFRNACHLAGLEVRQCLIWVKNTMVLGRQDYQWKHEPCLYGWKEGAAHLWASDRKQTTILEFDKPTRNGEHPTMKPVPLFDYQMKNNTKGGDIVLDLFGGSGTTIIAAEQNGRTGYLMEYDPRYVDVIIDRWETLTNEKAELLEDVPDAE